jgi:hypothetical protein
MATFIHHWHLERMFISHATVATACSIFCWLIASETGYPGPFTFVVFLLRSPAGDGSGDLMLGAGGRSFIFIPLASELYALDPGLVAGPAGQLDRLRRPHLQNHRFVGRIALTQARRESAKTFFWILNWGEQR